MKEVVYINPVTAMCREFYGLLLDRVYEEKSVKAHFNDLSERFREGVVAKHPIVEFYRSNFRITKDKLSKIDCQRAILLEYGFKDEPAMDLKYSPEFEVAVNHLIMGEHDALREQLKENPGLVHERSSYNHNATLLHYAGSNGVEMWRQIVPYNLPEMVELLLNCGADKRATMDVYGGKFDTKTMIGTSAHPYEAGVIEDTLKLL